MAKSKICDHPDRKKIESEIVADDLSLQKIADKYGVSKASIYRHKSYMQSTLQYQNSSVFEIDAGNTAPELLNIDEQSPVQACKVCIFWHSTNNEQGQCRRYPPQCLPSNYQRFPLTDASTFCGEFVPDPNQFQ